MKNFFQISLNILFLLFTKTISAVLDLNLSNYEEFISTNKEYMINLCLSRLEKCRQMKSNFKEVSKLSLNDLGIDLPIGIIDVDTYPELSEKYVSEGFPTIFFVENESIEVYIGSKEVNKIMKYLKFKLFSDIQEVSNEQELFQAASKYKNENSESTSLIFFGLAKRAPFSLQTLSRAGKIAGINKIFTINDKEYLNKLNIDDFDVALLNIDSNNNAEIRRLSLTEEDDLAFNKIKQIILINKRNLKGFFTNLSSSDLELSLNKNIATLYYIYSDKKQLANYIENDIIDLAKRYTNEFLFVKTSINNKSLKQIQMAKFFNLTKDDLPAIVLTAENPFSTDDVEKYIVKGSQLFSHRQKQFEEQRIENANLDNKDLITKQTVENFIENYKKGKLYKTYFTEIEELEMKMTGENFVPAIDEALENGNEIVLLICPRISKKYKRIRARLERAFDKIYKSNENKILFDEIDPFTNELSYIDYQYVPSIAIIQKNFDQFSTNKWIVTIKNKGFTNEEIVDFVKVNTKIGNFKVNITDIDSLVTNEEKKRPLFPILKDRLEGKFLTDNLVKYEIGFKRRWANLKKNGLVNIKKSENEFEEDFEDNFDVNDDIDEESYYKREDL